MIIINKDILNIIELTKKKYANDEKDTKNIRNLKEEQKELENRRTGRHSVEFVNLNMMFNDNVKEFIKRFMEVDQNGMAKVYKTMEILNNHITLPQYIIRTIGQHVLKNENKYIIARGELIIFIKTSIIKQYKFLIFDKRLKTSYKDFEFNGEIEDKIMYSIAHHAIEKLKESGLVKEFYGFKKDHGVPYIEFTSQVITNMSVLDINTRNMPMVSLPNKWIREGNRYINGGYYHNTNTDKDDFMVFTKEKSLQTEVNDKIIDNINYLQSMPYKINIKKLDVYFSDLSKVLCDGNIDIHKYKTQVSYISSGSGRGKKGYRAEINKARLILETLYQARRFQKYKKIYFPYFIDFRGRAYSRGYPLSPQGGKISKEILMLKAEEKEEFKSYDISASVIQMFGLLLYNKKYLIQTNLIGKENNDVYTDIVKKYNLFEDEEDPRSIFKKIAITFLYNESHLGTFKKISGIFLEDTNEHTHKIRNILKEEFSDIVEFRNMLSQNTNKNEEIPIKYGNKNYIYSQQLYVKQEKIHIRYYIFDKKRKQITVNQDIVPFKKNVRAVNRATVPNIIHNLDAMIMHKVIEYFRIRKKRIATVHDCFKVSVKNKDYLRQAYQKSIQEIFFKNTPLEKIKIENNFSMDIDKFLLRKKKLENEFKENDITNKNLFKEEN